MVCFINGNQQVVNNKHTPPRGSRNTGSKMLRDLASHTISLHTKHKITKHKRQKKERESHARFILYFKEAVTAVRAERSEDEMSKKIQPSTGNHKTTRTMANREKCRVVERDGSFFVCLCVHASFSALRFSSLTTEQGYIGRMREHNDVRAGAH
jgi:hypothetical protein